MGNIYPRIPVAELMWEQISLKEGAAPEYFVTSDKRREAYKLWKKERGGFSLLFRAKTPPELHKKLGRF